MSFEEKVKSMSAQDIIMAMVNSLIPPPAIPIDMNTFGELKEEVIKPAFTLLGITIIPEKTRQVCFGCAATNTVCGIAGKVFDVTNIYSQEKQAEFLETPLKFLDTFERAIDALRKGSIADYNGHAGVGGFAKIDVTKIPQGLVLPLLDNDYTVQQLEKYTILADSQK